MTQSRPAGRGSDSRRRAPGPGPRSAAIRPVGPASGRGSGRPAPRPGARPGPRRARGSTGTASRQAAPRARFTGRAAILVLVLAVLMVSYASSMRAYLEQRRHLADLTEQIGRSRAAIADLEREKKRWEDPAYVRTVAHQRFGWVLPGEIGFQVLDDDGKPLGHHDTLSDPDAVVEANRPLWWQVAWGSVVAAGKPDRRELPPPVTRIRPPTVSQDER
jgi:cell division protein FtsB